MINLIITCSELSSQFNITGSRGIAGLNIVVSTFAMSMSSIVKLQNIA